MATTAIKLLPPTVFNAELTKCWQTLQGGRTIAVYRCLIDVTGSLKSAIMLSQLIYWTRVSTEVTQRDGWIYKSIAQMEEETGLSIDEQNQCKKRLKALNLIETSRKGLGAPLAFRINLPELANALCSVNQDDKLNLSIADLQSNNSLFFRRYFSKRIAYHRDLVTLTGCVHAAVMLSCVLQDSIMIANVEPDKRHSFATLTSVDWQDRIALSYKSQRTARNKLKALKFIFETHFIASRRIFTLVNSRTILGVVHKLLSGKRKDNFSEYNTEKREIMAMAERAKWYRTKGQNGEYQGVIEDLAGKDSPTPNANFRNGKRAYSEMGKGQIKKQQIGNLNNGKWSDSEMGKGQIVLYLDYKEYNYNYNNLNLAKLVKPIDVVVVDDDLIFPKCFNALMRQQAIQILNKILPSNSFALKQEILDEIAGQKKEVNSPLGLLLKLCNLADQKNFIAMVAPSVKASREMRLKNETELAKRLLESKPQDSSSVIHADSTVRDNALKGALEYLTKKSGK